MVNKVFGRKKNTKKFNNSQCEIPSIIVECPSGNKVKYLDDANYVQIENGNKSDDDDDDDDDNDDDESDAHNLNRCNYNNRLRRKSISLPNIGDFELKTLKNADSDLEELKCNYSNSENDLSDDELFQDVTKSHIRNARRKSVSSPNRMLKVGDDDNSPANSITSVNSLASLLKEKMQMLPATLRKKKPKDYKIRVFVGILFLAIIFLVGFAYILYQQKVLQRAYFDKIKFNKAKRIMKIYDNDGTNVIIKGRLGTTLYYDKVHPCLEANGRNDGSICLEWMEKARLYLNTYQINSEVRCYSLNWLSLSDDIEPTDCFDVSSPNTHWYGGGQTAENAWPLDIGDHEFAPFITGRINRHQWGNVLKRYFINSNGAAIIVDNETPLYVSIQQKKELCLKAKYDEFAFVNRLTPLPHLNYSVCTSTNTTKLHSYLTEKALWDGIKFGDITVIDSLLTEPLWEITASSKEEFNEGTVFNYTEDLYGLPFLKQGHVLINEFWQRHIGDFTVDNERFPTLVETIDMMHRRGFRIVFTIQPFISTESENFAETVKNRLLISERNSDRRIPALTRYKSLGSAAVLDVTNSKTIRWLQEKLKTVAGKYKFDAFYVDFGTAYNIPRYYQCEKPLTNPDQYKTIFVNSLQSNIVLFGTNSAVVRPIAPTFVSLPMFESSWTGIRRVIPTILTYGLIGYPFLIPGAVGGDFEAPGTNKNLSVSSEFDIVLPDKELYVRWLQLATFLPVIRFTHLPSKYGDEKVLEMARILTSLRQNTVSPLLKQYASKALESGLPLIRPLWMLETNDPACHMVADEFAVGEDLIVAPVLYSGSREREVYLPAGMWKDGIDGSLRKGNRWMHDYKVEEDQVAYFLRMPDNTRFN